MQQTTWLAFVLVYGGLWFACENVLVMSLLLDTITYVLHEETLKLISKLQERASLQQIYLEYAERVAESRHFRHASIPWFLSHLIFCGLVAAIDTILWANLSGGAGPYRLVLKNCLSIPLCAAAVENYRQPVSVLILESIFSLIVAIVFFLPLVFSSRLSYTRELFTYRAYDSLVLCPDLSPADMNQFILMVERCRPLTVYVLGVELSNGMILALGLFYVLPRLIPLGFK